MKMKKTKGRKRRREMRQRGLGKLSLVSGPGIVTPCGGSRGTDYFRSFSWSKEERILLWMIDNAAWQRRIGGQKSREKETVGYAAPGSSYEGRMTESRGVLAVRYDRHVHRDNL
ncbi:hypothetical protein ALC62_09837 [Cyphomyrmex costatus]|uniref:Uncharacterized protein n=1 Tax=Cyphomyrmex costatus TaxID=456900 RepID=A0A195CFK3_9HYME|nr:hypothetical protein ALC62_09837 [Cyphomyrmex costatus]